MFFEILLGLIPGIPVYFVLSRALVGKRPVEYRVAPTAITAIIEDYRKTHLAVEDNTSQPVLEASKKTSAPEQVKPNPVKDNYQKWSQADRDTKVPLITGSVAVLRALSEMSALHHTLEEQHSLEVLSNQTNELLSNFFATPESIRTMPEVEAALSAQLLQIEKGVSNLKVAGAENVIRNLNAGTEFIKTRFWKNEN